MSNKNNQSLLITAQEERDAALKEVAEEREATRATYRAGYIHGKYDGKTEAESQLTALRQALAKVIPLAEIDCEGVMDQQEYDAIIQNAKLALDGSPTGTGEAP